jgi:large subunit ribosomal protein L7A
MSYDKVKQADSLVTGLKQTRKAIDRQIATLVIMAEDAELNLTKPIQRLCEAKGVPFTFVASMRDLGKASGIQVGTAAIAILKR